MKALTSVIQDMKAGTWFQSELVFGVKRLNFRLVHLLGTSTQIDGHLEMYGAGKKDNIGLS